MTCNCTCNCNKPSGSVSGAMTISKNGVQFITDREGSRSKMYLDSAGLPTIGVGHLLTKSENNSGKINIAGINVIWRNGLTANQIAQLLNQDLDVFEDAVNKYVKVPLTQSQFDTLVSFSFNVGVGAFSTSTLLKRLNAGEYDDVPDQLERWRFAGGRIIPGLINRRALEGQLWAS
ncbi:lysozyme [Psychrobacter celer]|uniref:lysozyme n=1 Tax=Psychrobacter celer TaxID=306572 RepID=UPI003FD0AFD9